MRAAIIYPHQLYANHPAIEAVDSCVLVEEPLFFTQYRFHAQKLVLHRASLMAYARRLRAQGHQVCYVGCDELADTGSIASLLGSRGISDVQFVEPNDDWLRTRLTAALDEVGIAYRILTDPHFLTSDAVFADYVRGRKRLFFADFYAFQRKRLGILIDQAGKPAGGQWSFDGENRKRLPQKLNYPWLRWPRSLPEVSKAIEHVSHCFPNAIGEASDFRYPVTHDQAERWLRGFLDERLFNFGQYEDAMSDREAYLFHSILTPMLNIGLLSPRQVVDGALQRGEEVPLNSLEGFLRQVIGWREFVRGVYQTAGRRQRSRNFWEHAYPMPAAFYSAETGIEPVDCVIDRVTKHAYCHHIERLMILGNFMMLCEIHPDAVHRWFSELFIDSYDWVMVPNVYGMSQHADGGLMTTKPYISASSYILKMSHFRKGPWCEIWDALYWRFVAKHRKFFAASPRMGMMTSHLKKMGDDKLKQHQQTAERYLAHLHGGACEGLRRPSNEFFAAPGHGT